MSKGRGRKERGMDTHGCGCNGSDRSDGSYGGNLGDYPFIVLNSSVPFDIRMFLVRRIMRKVRYLSLTYRGSGDYGCNGCDGRKGGGYGNCCWHWHWCSGYLGIAPMRTD